MKKRILAVALICLFFAFEFRGTSFAAEQPAVEPSPEHIITALVKAGNEDGTPCSMSASGFSSLFFTEAENTDIMLVGDVTLDNTASGEISLCGGTHNLYLNGYTLDLSGILFTVSDAILNIYGGADKTDSGSGRIETETAGDAPSYAITVGDQGIVNLFGGFLSANSEKGETCGVFADRGIFNMFGGTVMVTAADTFKPTAVFVEKGVANIYGGEITGDCSEDSYALYSRNLINVTGGTFTGKVEADSPEKIRLAGGTFSANPEMFLLSGCTKAGSGPYIVESGTNAAVRIETDGAMTGHTTLKDALSVSSTVVMLKDLNENVTISGNAVTLDLNGKVLDGNTSRCGSVIAVTANDAGVPGSLMLLDTAPSAKHTGAYSSLPEGGVITGGTGTANADNTASNGGGVYIASGFFTMNGGTICNNNVSNGKGGGVYEKAGSIFIMNGGSISNNSANSGIDSTGSGVHVLGAFIMNGGSISNNRGGDAGVLVVTHLGGSLTLGGTATISGNTKADNTAANLDCNPFSISDKFPLRDGASVWLFQMSKAPGHVVCKNAVETDTRYFFSDSPDFDISYVDGKGLIVQKQLTVSGTKISGSKVYDGDTRAEVRYAGTIESVFGVSLATATASYVDKDVGTDKAVTVVYSLSGINADLYAVKNAEMTADITAKQIIVTDVKARDKIYDGTNLAEVSISADGFVHGDDVTISAEATFENAKVGKNKAVKVVFSLTGADAANYAVPAVQTVEASIQARNCTVR